MFYYEGKVYATEEDLKEEKERTTKTDSKKGLKESIKMSEEVIVTKRGRKRKRK